MVNPGTAALCIGMSKTGVQGMMLLIVPYMAMAFGAKESPGVILPMLCMADIMAVAYYKRIADWKVVAKLLPTALLGFLVALFVDKFVPARGFTTMIGNAAGPVMSVYLLSMRKEKMEYIGINAWFFLVVNLQKVPFQIFAWDNINWGSFSLNLLMLPVIGIGALLGIRLVKLFPEKAFRRFIQIVTILSVAMMLV